MWDPRQVSNPRRADHLALTAQSRLVSKCNDEVGSLPKALLLGVLKIPANVTGRWDGSVDPPTSATTRHRRNDAACPVYFKPWIAFLRCHRDGNQVITEEGYRRFVSDPGKSLSRPSSPSVDVVSPNCLLSHPSAVLCLPGRPATAKLTGSRWPVRA